MDMEKKKLLLIGNNELSDDFSSIINEYDMVVRVNMAVLELLNWKD